MDLDLYHSKFVRPTVKHLKLSYFATAPGWYYTVGPHVAASADLPKTLPGGLAGVTGSWIDSVGKRYCLTKISWWLAQAIDRCSRWCFAGLCDGSNSGKRQHLTLLASPSVMTYVFLNDWCPL
jgi:hypothetical protein